ncbi:DUF721 domain-containing protein [Wenzhouxiangella sp. XN79A]|uniref:DciA family protein n=1 Tax=Wenzhouxiangella sp. XN79A TaxID=2724193 RepID=UPI00144A866D|nr:DciA family protein [Wenzhouxiangella sp. XN79A]NKI34321.1 DUF721 domain-containing protein [Wenzhouxiangella sp. XN79A]
MAGKRETRARNVREIARDAGGQAGGLRQALRRAEAYLALNERLAPMLPDSMRDAVRVACIEDTTLVLAAASPARATQARLQQAVVLEAASRLWPTPLTEVRVIIVPDE